MKAYSVQDETGECYGAIVFHESASKARYFAMNNVEYFEDHEFSDFTVRREPKADVFATDQPSVLNFCDNAEFFHSLGWTCHVTGECDIYVCPFKKDEGEPFPVKESGATSANMA